jgi:hypothetical protein
VKPSNRAGLRSLYILLHEEVYLRLPTYINSGNTGMMGSRESSVGEGGIIDLDFIIPIQRGTILLNYGKAVKLMTGFSTQNSDKKRSLGGCDAKKSDRSNCC